MVVVLPQTVRGNEAFWNEIPKTVVFCRDKASFEFMKGFEQHEVFLADDMATGLQMSEPPYAAISAYRRHLDGRALWSSDRVQAFRADDEGTKATRSEIDFSAFAHPRMTTKEDIVSHATFFLSMIAGAKTVATDRLHVAVGCGLLGIPCEISDNSYGKLRGVYENTLAEKFPSLTFRD